MFVTIATTHPAVIQTIYLLARPVITSKTQRRKDAQETETPAKPIVSAVIGSIRTTPAGITERIVVAVVALRCTHTHGNMGTDYVIYNDRPLDLLTSGSMPAERSIDQFSTWIRTTITESSDQSQLMAGISGGASGRSGRSCGVVEIELDDSAGLFKTE